MQVLLHKRCGRRTREDIEAYISRLSKNIGHADLDAEYEKIYELNTGDENMEDAFESRDRMTATKCYQLVLCSQRPLSLEEVVAGTGLNEDGSFDSNVTEEYLREITANILTQTSERMIQFSHLSAREYLTRRHSQRFANASNHLRAAKTCLAAFRGLPPERGGGPAHMTDQLYWQQHGVLHRPFINYALSWWPLHCREAVIGKCDHEDLQSQLESFLNSSPEPERGSPYHQWAHYFFHDSHKARSAWPRDKREATYQSNCLGVACAWGVDDLVRYVLRLSPEQTQHNNGFATFPVHIASLCGNAGALKSIIDADATSVHKTGPNGGTPLHVAANCGQLEIVRLLLAHGAAAGATRPDGRTPLHLASGLDSESLRQKVLGAGRVNNGGWKGRPPTWNTGMKTTGIHEDVLRVLVAHGADIRAKDSEGCTPFFYAVLAGRTELAQVLMDHGVRIAEGHGWDCSVLEVCAAWGHIDFSRLLLSRGEYGRPVGYQGNEIMCAVTFAQIEMVEVLLDAGFDIEEDCGTGSTPLLLAVDMGYLAIVKRLIQRGARLQAKDSNGRDALRIAKEHRKTELRREKSKSPWPERHYRFKMAPPVYAPWKALIRLLGREYRKTILYPPFRGQSPHSLCWT